jgi:hypothetical protein
MRGVRASLRLWTRRACCPSHQALPSAVAMKASKEDAAAGDCPRARAPPGWGTMGANGPELALGTDQPARPDRLGGLHAVGPEEGSVGIPVREVGVPGEHGRVWL